MKEAAADCLGRCARAAVSGRAAPPMMWRTRSRWSNLRHRSLWRPNLRMERPKRWKVKNRICRCHITSQQQLHIPKFLSLISHLLTHSDIKVLVQSVDLLSSKTGQNRVEHHTDLYDGDEMIIRRGQTFQIEMELNRPFNASTDKLHLDLKTGTVTCCTRRGR